MAQSPVQFSPLFLSRLFPNLCWSTKFCPLGHSSLSSHPILTLFQQWQRKLPPLRRRRHPAVGKDGCGVQLMSLRKKEDFFWRLVVSICHAMLCYPCQRSSVLTKHLYFQLDFTLLTFGTLGMLIKWVSRLVISCEPKSNDHSTDRYLEYHQCFRFRDERRPQPLRKSVQLHRYFMDGRLYYRAMGILLLLLLFKLSSKLTWV